MVQTTNPRGAAKAVVGMKGGVECSIHSGGTSFGRVVTYGAALLVFSAIVRSTDQTIHTIGGALISVESVV